MHLKMFTAEESRTIANGSISHARDEILTGRTIYDSVHRARELDMLSEHH